MIDASLDTILRIGEILSILGGGGAVAFRLGRSTQQMQAAIDAHTTAGQLQGQQITELRNEVRKLGDILTKLALQEQRLDMLDKRYEELRHGEGFAFPLGTIHNRST